MRKFVIGLLTLLTLALQIGYLVLARLNDTAAADQIGTAAFFPFPLVGIILISRHPRNPVGYLVTVVGVAVQLGSTLYEYALLAQTNADLVLPFSGVAALLSLFFWSWTMPGLVLLLLLFPNGQWVNPRWKALAIFAVIFTIPLLIADFFFAWPSRSTLILMDLQRIPNSEGMETLNRYYEAWNLIMIAVIILAMISFFIRFARSRGTERQQLKWFVVGWSLVPASMIMDLVFQSYPNPLVGVLNTMLNVVSTAAFPLTLLIAITRFRLYDIDFIIRRTLLYTLLTATLAAIYLGAVLVIQWLFSRGIGEQSEFGVVLSTLLIAALFQPLRRKFQQIIDQRFYRSKYDAEETLAHFATRLQNEVDLEAIQGYLVRAVEENIQPEGASLWLVKKN